MSKRVLILFAVGLAAIVAAFLILKYELTKKDLEPELEQEPEQEPEQEHEKETYNSSADEQIVDPVPSDDVVLIPEEGKEVKTKKTAKNA